MGHGFSTFISQSTTKDLRFWALLVSPVGGMGISLSIEENIISYLMACFERKSKVTD